VRETRFPQACLSLWARVCYNRAMRKGTATPLRDILAIDLQSHRRRLGMSQATLAAHLGVSRECVSQYERGVCSPNLTRLRLLLGLLGML
jgi:DNA-binding XRE family transcriptional regulator